MPSGLTGQSNSNVASVKTNILLNGINTVTGILFPLITFPYAARILLPEGIGIVNFQMSIINYIVLLTSIGIPMYAIKEVARHQNDRQKRDTTTVEILILSTVLCLIGYVGVWALAEYVPRIHQEAKLFYVLSLTIIFTTVGVSWFYQGIEDFKFITIRGIIVRVVSACALFVFVRDADDLIAYGLITVGSTVGNNLINFAHLRKHIEPRNLQITFSGIIRHLNPSLKVFVLNLIISLYIHLNSVMLGFLSDDEEVGFFTAGTKITFVALSIIGSLGAVLLPRCSNLIHENRMDEFKVLIDKSVRMLICLSLPIMAGLAILVSPIILAFCGDAFESSEQVMLWTLPIIFFISLTNLMGLQILYPMDKVSIVIKSVTGGALINIVLNLLLIPSYGATGAAIATLCAEGSVFVIQVFLGKKFYPFRPGDLLQPRYITGTLLMSAAIYPLSRIIDNIYLNIIVCVLSGIVIFATYLAISRDPMIDELKSFIHRK